MKKKSIFLCLLMVIMLLFSNKVSMATTQLSSDVIPDVENITPPASPEEVTQRLLEWQEKIPDGTYWDNYKPFGKEGYLGKSYRWGVQNDVKLGLGCVAFAYLMSDVAFGTMPYAEYTATKDNVRPGDVIRINDDRHSIIILQVNQDSFTIAEGNSGKRVRWGREIEKDKLIASITFSYTRYTDATDAAEDSDDSEDENDNANANKSDPTENTDTSDPNYIYACSQEQYEDYTCLYDSRQTMVDKFKVKSKKLKYKDKTIKLPKKIQYGNFNHVGNIILILKNNDFYVVNHDTLEVKKIGKNAKARISKNDILGYVVKKSGKLIDVSYM